MQVGPIAEKRYIVFGMITGSGPGETVDFEDHGRRPFKPYKMECPAKLLKSVDITCPVNLLACEPEPHALPQVVAIYNADLDARGWMGLEACLSETLGGAS